MRYFANELCYGDEADFWATVGLLHDLDFEQFPQQHCIKEQEILSKRPSWPCGAAKTPASPVVLGGLGDYFRDGTFPDIARYYRDINRQLDETAHILPRTGYVPAEGLEPNPDRLHFSARALAEFGQRYADVFRTLEDPNRVFTEKSDADGALRGPMERL